MAQTAKTTRKKATSRNGSSNGSSSSSKSGSGKRSSSRPSSNEREPDAQAGLHEREEDELDERPIEAAVERPVPKWIGIDPRYRR